MSKIQETAPDIIYLNIGGDTDDDLDFDLDAEVTCCHEPVFDNDIKYIKQPKLSIPKKIAEELEELTGKTNWESTPYSVIEEKGKINTWAYLGHGKCSEQLYKFCRDNTRLMHAYLNPLTRPFVEVEE